MSDDQSTKTIAGSVADVSNKIISVLPPAFLLLCLINVIFIGAVLWFLDHQMSQRVAMIVKFVDRCSEHLLAK